MVLRNHTPLILTGEGNVSSVRDESEFSSRPLGTKAEQAAHKNNNMVCVN